ncbi:phage tail protein [Paenibacillus thermotolerans]|uniref:phage tail protein n=1 Tax=Paenibacillus thermotolerans TaxID=3027807 RepID=UPI0023684603|nr:MULTISPECIES: tail fiber protein [unclassified Paenibacillus]
MSDQYVGEIRMFAGNYAPQGWAICDGSTLLINDCEALYTLIGTTYGGDGQTNFKLPDLRGRIPIFAGQNPKTGTSYALGQQGGIERVTLTLDQLPEHTHPANAQSNGSGNVNTPVNAFWAASTVNQYSKANADIVMNSNAISTEGAGQQHDNMMPYLAVTFIIALIGIYPSQS